MTSRYKRKGKGKFVQLEEYLMRSAAWMALTPNARAAYLELKRRYNGFNNGRIGLGERELARELHIGKDTARRALGELIEKGFLIKAKLSGFNMKNRTATEWRLTELKCDVTRALPSKEFTHWRPCEKNTGASQAHTGASQVHEKVRIGVFHA